MIMREGIELSRGIVGILIVPVHGVKMSSAYVLYVPLDSISRPFLEWLLMSDMFWTVIFTYARS